MKTPHKHAAIIKAWADGAEIEFFHRISGVWCPAPMPSWDEYTPYRIKPAPKPDIVENTTIYRNLNRQFDFQRTCGERFTESRIADVRLTFDGETGKLKAAEIL